MNPATLKALLMIAGKKDVRYYLNGVYIDHKKRLAIATDSHALLFIKLEPDDIAESSVIISRNAVENAVKIKNGQMCIGPHGHIDLGCMRSKPVDGRYPDVLRVVPDKTSGIVAAFDPWQLNRMQEAARLINTKNYVIKLHMNGPDAAIVNCGSNALGLVMPCRPSDTPVVEKHIKDMLDIIRGQS